MICRRCGKLLRRNDRFVLVGFYPGIFKRLGYDYLRALLDGPEYFGELYHETCYLESVDKQKMKQNESVES